MEKYNEKPKSEDKLADVSEEDASGITCVMYLAPKFYEQLTEEGKQIFDATPQGICAAFPAVVGEGITLANCVMSFCEVAYIGMNPKYETERASAVTCELYKPGKEDATFNILVTIEYPNDKTPHHELLILVQRKLTENLYSFELVGDQSMFAM